MTPKEIHFLMSPRGQKLLDKTRQEKDLAKRIRILRKETCSDYAALVSRQIHLQGKAQKKFTRAKEMLFDSEGLEQASAEVVSLHVGKRYQKYTSAVDLTCGMGGDALGLAQAQSLVVMDIMLSKVMLCQHNLSVYGKSALCLVSDATRWFPQGAQAYFMDPARRIQGKRVRRLEDSVPSIATLQRVLKESPNVGVKVSPALDYEELDLDCEIEVISVGGECREIMLWFGDLATTKRRATLLPQKVSLSSESYSTPPQEKISSFLYQVEKAALRAKLLDVLAANFELASIDPTLGYLTGEKVISSPWLTPYRVCHVMPFSEKKVRQELRKREAGKLSVKSKGFVREPLWWEKRLQVPGKNSCTLFLFRVSGSPLAVFTQPVSQELS